MRMVILDTETSGLEPGKNALLEIGAIILDGKLKEISRFQTYVKVGQGFEIDPKAMEINKIDLQLESEYDLLSIPPEVAVTAFNDWVLANCKGKVNKPFVAGWNPAFDVNFIRWYYNQYDLAWPFHYRMLDVQSINAFMNGFRFKSLKSTMAGQKHHALDDAVLVVKRLKQLKRRWDR